MTPTPMRGDREPMAGSPAHQTNPDAQLEPQAHPEAPYRLFVQSAGVNANKQTYPQHIWLALLEDPSGQLLWCNDDGTSPEVLDGSAADALYHAIRKAVGHIPDNANVLIFSPQDQVRHVFKATREERRRANYRGSDKKRRPQADTIKDIDDATERRGITIDARSPELHGEYDRLEEVRQGAAQRWEGLWRSPDADFRG